MSEPTTDVSAENSRPRKRKLRYPRTSNACAFCRKRKIRCSGTLPCEACTREESSCIYEAGAPPLATKRLTRESVRASDVPVSSTEAALEQSITLNPSESAPNSTSRRSSVGHAPDFFHEQDVGPTSGVSFLYHHWSKPVGQDEVREALSNDEGPMLSHARLAAYGDIPQIDPTVLASLPYPSFNRTQVFDILDRYFQYVSPTYRYLHHPTLKDWAAAYVSEESKLTAAQKACVLLVCAQTLLHSSATSGEPLTNNGDMRLSMACSERAKALLERESGPPSLASVQARIGMCLYFLSTFRLNECRYCFSFAITVATALGIHRRQSSSKVNSLDSECRKRTFWSAYVLDAYLSVMLGRPRLLRDSDIDQPFPHNIDDHDLISSEPIDTLPRHGNLEAFINHAKLSQLTGQSNDKLYPLHPLTYDEMLQRSIETLDALGRWETSLPEFLKPRGKTLTGQRTFERQNTILKLAGAHVRILATRRCLLNDLDNTEIQASLHSQEARAKRAIRECIIGITAILDTIEALIEHDQCYSPFWSTQYIALVALSTFYVLVIQGTRRALPEDLETLLDVADCFAKARRCHEHLAKLPPPGSQAQRHYLLLAHLRNKADRSKSRLATRGDGGTVQQPFDGSHREVSSRGDARVAASRLDGVIDISNPMGLQPNSSQATCQNDAETRPTTHAVQPTEAAVEGEELTDPLMFSSILTPNQSSDSGGFQFMLDMGWEGLDTVGAFMSSYDENGFARI